MLLEKIQQENDIKKIKPEDYPALAEEIRQFLIEKISETGGHLASNLGAVELTMALHLCLDFPEDKLIWDVGHQSYTHKILTGRKDGFDALRQYGGISGFPKRKESVCDAFDTGHSSTSISAGLGLVMARELAGEKHTVVSVIGDGSMTGGMAYEALNNASRTGVNYIVVLNDNEMSISENIGGMSQYLNGIRTNEKYLGLKDNIYYGLMEKKNGQKMVRGIQNIKNGIKQLVLPGMFFEDMGITYLGPVDGHNIKALIKAIQEAKAVNNTVVLHVKTQKGQGYDPAIHHPARFHGAEPFEIETGVPKKQKEKATYTDIFSTVIKKRADKDDTICAITAAMPDGTGLKRFRNCYPERFYDVGIAEEHAVTFAAGLAAGGRKPVVAIYSSFLQRAYDQMIHDVCLQDLPVVFAIDRAGLVGSDGETHQGIFDLSYLSSMPGMTVLAPKNKWELADMLEFAFDFDGPIAVRYPRGAAYDGLKEHREAIAYGKSELLIQGAIAKNSEKNAAVISQDAASKPSASDTLLVKRGQGRTMDATTPTVALVAVGTMVQTAMEVREKLLHEGIDATVVNARFVKPLDTDMLTFVASSHSLVVTLEENVAAGGFGSNVLWHLQSAGLLAGIKFLSIALPDAYIEHGNVELLKKKTGIDAASVYEKICDALKGGKKP